jgi:hypothetical protein
MPVAEHALINACRTLFGDTVNLSPEFLTYLQPSGAKVAFRTQAKQHHPDRFAGAPQEIRTRQTERFREIHQAYSLLNDFFAARQRPARPGAHAARPCRPTRPSQPHPATTSNRDALPPLPLEFGLFAFYSGRIDYRDLIDALVWQRRQRPTIGALARQWGWLSADKVAKILGHRGNGGRFGRRAVALGLLTPLQVDALLRHQRNHQQRLGQYFVERGLLSTDDADQLACELDRHNARFAAQPR